MRFTSASIRRLAIVAALAAPGSAIAQLPSASAAAQGMGGNFTAIARGFEAVAWNPANLGMAGRPLVSLGTLIGGGTMGMDPVDFRALSEYSDQVVPADVRREWVNNARLSGGQTIRLDGGVTLLGLSVGPVGLQAGGSTALSIRLSPDAWEAMLFGNAGNNGGQPKEIDLTGTSIRGAVTSAVGMSFAFPLPFRFTGGALAGEHFALGLTGKYVMGHGLLIAEDLGSSIGTGTEVEINFPLIMNRLTSTSSSGGDDEYEVDVGNGVGVDLGMAWAAGKWRVGLLAENLYNSFAWDTTALSSRSGVGYFSTDSSDSDFETEYTFSQAPQQLRAIVLNQGFRPAFTVGAAYRLWKSLTLTADLKQSTGGDDAIVVGPRSRVGVGAEWRPLGFLPIRGGIASITDGWQAGAGIGLRLFGYELGASTSIRRRGVANESGFMLSLVGIGR